MAIDSPLNDMTGSFKHRDEPQPDQKFSQEVLPSFKRVVTSRRSIRVFSQEPIPEEIMQDCFRDAILAPSSSNLQPYQLIWVREESKKKQLAEACLNQPAATTAGELIAVVARRDLWRPNLNKLMGIMTRNGSKELPKALKKYYSEIIPKMMADDGFGLFNLFRRLMFFFVGFRQPIVRSPINKGDHRVWAHIQASLVAQNLMMSLTAHGYDSCPMGGFDEKRARKVLNLTKQAEVSMMIAAGTRKPEGLYGARIRLPVEDLVKTI